MRLKTLDLVCPKCKQGAKIKVDKLTKGVLLKCYCHSTLTHYLFRFALSEWIAYLGEIDSFKDFEDMCKKSK